MRGWGIVPLELPRGHSTWQVRAYGACVLHSHACQWNMPFDEDARAVRPYWSSEVPHEQLLGNFDFF